MIRVLAASTALVTVLFVPTSAKAQLAQPADIGVSYSFHRLLDSDGDLNMPAGWLVSLTKPIGDSPLSAVGEVAGSYKSQFGETLRLHTFQGGLRITGNRQGTVRPFAQFVLGAMNAGCCGESQTYFSVEPGGGVDVRLNARSSLRLGASLPTAFNEGDRAKSVRFHVGLSVPFGKR